jgi:hypothetical protein
VRDDNKSQNGVQVPEATRVNDGDLRARMSHFEDESVERQQTGNLVFVRGTVPPIESETIGQSDHTAGICEELTKHRCLAPQNLWVLVNSAA